VRDARQRRPAAGDGGDVDDDATTPGVRRPASRAPRNVPRRLTSSFAPGAVMGDEGVAAFVCGAPLEKYAPGHFAKQTVTAADMLTPLYSVKNEKLGGLLSGITFPKGPDRTTINQFIEPVMLRGGKFVQNGDFVCAPNWKARRLSVPADRYLAPRGVTNELVTQGLVQREARPDAVVPPGGSWCCTGTSRATSSTI